MITITQLPLGLTLARELVINSILEDAHKDPGTGLTIEYRALPSGIPYPSIEAAVAAEARPPSIGFTIYQFTARNGTAFTARLLRQGDAFGLDDGLIHKGAPVIEFFDARHSHTPLGQFISRYAVTTLAHDLAAASERTNLVLDTGSEDWIVDDASVADVLFALVP